MSERVKPPILPIGVSVLKTPSMSLKLSEEIVEVISSTVFRDGNKTYRIKIEKFSKNSKK
jgi:hypothetical protein